MTVAKKSNYKKKSTVKIKCQRSRGKLASGREDGANATDEHLKSQPTEMLSKKAKKKTQSIQERLDLDQPEGGRARYGQTTLTIGDGEAQTQPKNKGKDTRTLGAGKPRPRRERMCDSHIAATRLNRQLMGCNLLTNYRANYMKFNIIAVMLLFAFEI